MGGRSNGVVLSKHPVGDLRDIGIGLVIHEQHMHILKLVDGFAPVEFSEAGWRDNEAVEDDLFVAQPLFNVLDDLMKLDLLVPRPFMLKTVGLDEGEVLFAILDLPEQEIGIEVSGFEKADTTTTTFISQ